MVRNKQLGNVSLEEVLEKRRLDQALNAKEFAVLAGVSYSLAREWFRFSGFPTIRGVVFWSDFSAWRRSQAGFETSRSRATAAPAEAPPPVDNKAGLQFPTASGADSCGSRMKPLGEQGIVPVSPMLAANRQGSSAGWDSGVKTEQRSTGVFQRGT